jgi:hypothetical protein
MHENQAFPRYLTARGLLILSSFAIAGALLALSAYEFNERDY